MFSYGSHLEILQAVKDMEVRHSELLNLNKNIEELNQLFVNLAVLVEEQGQLVNNIEFQVEATSNYAMTAHEQLKQAVIHQRNRQRKCRILVIFFLLVLTALTIYLLIHFGVIRKPGEERST
jgi:t-SNARE complex subunit (syntaxin)